MPRILNVFIDPHVTLRRDEALDDCPGSDRETVGDHKTDGDRNTGSDREIGIDHISDSAHGSDSDHSSDSAHNHGSAHTPGSAGLQPAPAREMDVHVAGLACAGICARRTQAGLSALPGVRDVTFDPDHDTFTLRYQGNAPAHGDVQAAVRAQVIAKPARKLLAWISRPFRRAVTP